MIYVETTPLLPSRGASLEYFLDPPTSVSAINQKTIREFIMPPPPRRGH